MNQDTMLKYVFIPAYVLTLITAIRTPLQILAPDHAMTPMFSSVVPMFAIFLLWPILLQRKGLTYSGFLKVFLAVIFLVRLPVSAAYGLAVAFQWTEPSGELARYVRDFGNAGTASVVLQAQLIPMAIGTIIATLVWTIAWAVAFRGKRSWSGAALQG